MPHHLWSEWSLFTSAWTEDRKRSMLYFLICWSDIRVPPRWGILYDMWTLSCKNKAGFFLVPKWQLHSQRSSKTLNPFVPLWTVDSLLSSRLGWVRMRSNFKVAFVLILAMSPFSVKNLSHLEGEKTKKKKNLPLSCTFERIKLVLESWLQFLVKIFSHYAIKNNSTAI